MARDDRDNKTESAKQDGAGNFNDVRDIIDHYRTRKRGEVIINHSVEDRVFKRLANIPPETRTRVIDWLMENHPRNFGLDLMAINEAVTQIRGYTTPYVPAQKVTCGCCGLGYQYKLSATDDDKLNRGIFDRCPRCGHKHEDTLAAEQYAQKAGGYSDLYKAELKARLENWLAGGQKWHYDRDEELRWARDLEARDAEKRRAFLAEQDERLRRIR
jgi:hypothetical protein